MITEIRKELLHILQHSLGVDEYGQGNQYRNHYCAGGADIELCRELVICGYMNEHASKIPIGDSVFFTVTDSGKLAMSELSPAPPKLTRSQKRYQRYLEYGDGFDSFRDFLLWDSEPERSWNRG